MWEDQKMKETVKYLLQYLDQNFFFLLPEELQHD